MKTPNPYDFTGDFYQVLRKKQKFFTKYSRKQKRREYFPTHFMKPALPQYQHGAKISQKNEIIPERPLSLMTRHKNPLQKFI